MVTWLLNVVSPSIAQNDLWLNTTREISGDLHDIFSQRDAFRLSDLIEEFCALGSDDVTQYFTKMKIVWDEIQNLRPVPNCECVPKCDVECKTLKAVKEHMESDCIIKFLKGLNGIFTQVRSQISLSKPLPSINDAFSMELQHERQYKYFVVHVQYGGNTYVPLQME